MGFKVIAMLGMLAVATGGLAYITHAIASGAAAKVEARHLAKAAQVQRASTEDVTERSAAAQAGLEEDLAESRGRADEHRRRADQAEARLAAVEAMAKEEGEEPGTCQPGCTPAWE